MAEHSPEPLGDVIWAAIDKAIVDGKAARRQLLEWAKRQDLSLPTEDARRAKVHRCLQGLFSVFDTSWGIKLPDEDREDDDARRALVLELGKKLLGPETEFEELT